MAYTKVSREQFEHLAEGKVRHRPSGITFSAYPKTDRIDVEISHQEQEANEDGYEYDHDEVKRMALEVLRDLGSGASR